MMQQILTQDPNTAQEISQSMECQQNLRQNIEYRIQEPESSNTCYIQPIQQLVNMISIREWINMRMIYCSLIL